MLVRIFKTNQVYIFGFLPILLLLIAVPNLNHPAALNPSGQLPFVQATFELLSRIPVWSAIFAIVLIVHQGFHLVKACEENRMMPFSTNFPAFILALNYAVLAWQQLLSPVLIANTFLILAIRRIMLIYNQKRIDSTLFRAGIYISVASLFYMPSLLFFPVLLYHLWLFRPFSWREWVVPVTAIITPYIYVFCIYFLLDQTYILFNSLNSLSVFYDSPYQTFIDFLPIISTALLAASALAFLPATDNRRTVRINNLYKVTFVSLLFISLSALVLQEDKTSFIILLLPAMSVVQSYFVLSIEKRWLKESVIYLIILFIALREIASSISLIS